jgi:hypothetical protein
MTAAAPSAATPRQTGGALHGYAPSSALQARLHRMPPAETPSLTPASLQGGPSSGWPVPPTPPVPSGGERRNGVVPPPGVGVSRMPTPHPSPSELPVPSQLQAAAAAAAAAAAVGAQGKDGRIGDEGDLVLDQLVSGLLATPCIRRRLDQLYGSAPRALSVGQGLDELATAGTSAPVTPGMPQASFPNVL